MVSHQYLNNLIYIVCYLSPLVDQILTYHWFIIIFQTFVAIAPRFKNKYIHRFHATKALGLLTPWNPVRKLAVYIATNQFFDYLVILTILCNCVFLAMPDDPASETAE